MRAHRWYVRSSDSDLSPGWTIRCDYCGSSSTLSVSSPLAVDAVARTVHLHLTAARQFPEDCSKALQVNQVEEVMAS